MNDFLSRFYSIFPGQISLLTWLDVGYNFSNSTNVGSTDDVKRGQMPDVEDELLAGLEDR